MNKITVLLIAFFAISSCKKEVKITEGYQLNGVVKNVPDSTLIKMLVNRRAIDSTLVINEKFQFTGDFKEPTEVYLVIEKTNDFKVIWLENKKIDFIAEKGRFQDCKILGSNSQKEAEKLSEILKPLNEHSLSLYPFMRDKSLPKPKKDSIRTLFKDLDAKKNELRKEFVKTNPNYIVSTNLLYKLKSRWGKQTTSDLFDLMNDERKVSSKGKEIAKYIALAESPKIGERYVDFEQENTKGQKIKLSEIKGKFILVEFWAAWCKPCRISNPDLIKAFNRFNKDGFEILGVSLDNDKINWLKAIKEDGLPWQNVSDLKGFQNDAAMIYEVKSIPDNILIDPNGVIIGRRLHAKELAEKLEEAFKEKASL